MAMKGRTKFNARTTKHGKSIRARRRHTRHLENSIYRGADNMAHRYAHGDIVAAINKQFEGLQPFGGVIDRPSLSWTHAPKQSQSAAYHRYSRGTALQIIDGTNDMVVNVAYSPQGPLESVILHKFTDYYMKHAEDLPIFRKRPYDVCCFSYAPRAKLHCRCILTASNTQPRLAQSFSRL